MSDSNNHRIQVSFWRSKLDQWLISVICLDLRCQRKSSVLLWKRRLRGRTIQVPKVIQWLIRYSLGCWREICFQGRRCRWIRIHLRFVCISYKFWIKFHCRVVSLQLPILGTIESKSSILMEVFWELLAPGVRVMQSSKDSKALLSCRTATFWSAIVKITESRFFKRETIEVAMY